MSRKSNLDQTQQRPQLCTGSRNPGVVSLPRLPPEYHCNRDRKGCIIASNSELFKLIYRCIAMIFLLMLQMFNSTGNINQIQKFKKKLIFKSLQIFGNSRSAHVLEFLDHVWNQSLVSGSQSADPQNMDVCINCLLSCLPRSLKTQKYG